MNNKQRAFRLADFCAVSLATDLQMVETASDWYTAWDDFSG